LRKPFGLRDLFDLAARLDRSHRQRVLGCLELNLHVRKLIKPHERAALIARAILEFPGNIRHPLEKPIERRRLATEKRAILRTADLGKARDEIVGRHLGQRDLAHGFNASNFIKASKPTCLRTSQFSSRKYSLGDKPS